MYDFGDEEIRAVVDTLRGKKLFKYDKTGNNITKKFENELSNYFSVNYSILVNQGTSALVCALVGVGIQPGDEIIIPAYSYVALAQSVLNIGAIPVLCEIDETLNIDPIDIEKKITIRTKGIIAVHSRGTAADMNKIMEIGRKYNLKIIEDVCQSIGGKYDNKYLGTIGDVGVFSFNQFKILTAGEGGAVITNHKKIYEKAYNMHDGSCGHCGITLDSPLFAGLSFRVSEITASILSVQLKKLNKILEKQNHIKSKVIEKLTKFNVINQNCSDCGTNIIVKFKNSEDADFFCNGLKRIGLRGQQANKYEWHNYTDWEFLFSSRGAYSEQINPIKNINYSKNMCPKTNEIIKRTVVLNLNSSSEKIRSLFSTNSNHKIEEKSDKTNLVCKEKHTKKIKLGLIGCGRVVEVGHIKSHSNNEDLIGIVSIADISTDRLNIVGDKLLIPQTCRFIDYKEMIDKIKPEMVCIALPHHLHKEVILYCLEKNMGIISEKPLVMNKSEIEEIHHKMKETNGWISVVHNYTKKATFKKIIQSIEDNNIEPHLLRFENLYSSPWMGRTDDHKKMQNWRVIPELSGGGPLIDNIYHYFYLAEKIAKSKIKSVKSNVTNVLNEYKTEDTVLLILEHENGAKTNIICGWSLRGQSQDVFEIQGKNESIQLYLNKGTFKIITSLQNSKTIKEYINDDYWGFSECFREIFLAFQNKKKPLHYDDSIRYLNFISEIYEHNPIF